MRLLLKVLAVAVLLAGVCMLGFEVWGEDFERLFNQEACAAYFARIRPWAWAVAVGLLVVDLLLPVPATGVMAALGSVYGPVSGSLVGATGSVLAGMLGYGLARAGGRRVSGWIAGEEEMRRFQAFFDRWGGLAIIVSRILPILPEVVAVLAGLARMRLRRFVAALVLGTVPTATLFACLGHFSRAEPWYGMVVAVGVPLLVWPVFLRFVGREPRISGGPE